ncbi:glycosyltransferase [Tunicatimonas pelagia]|uniref:glycosyltransferase n=1 Tax=Tunicatimonas pelagia TaxID=931531 RepID=UPI002666A042|nr:glycosyltransferase [Tunicatimonas pelagia]WKN43395.1 glycosyltransferase [Tunicatimonas pelagia]
MYQVDIKEGVRLDDYRSYATLVPAFNAFYNEALLLKRSLQERKIWMINSTEHGGGVAEMLPRMISILRQLGLQADWLVMETNEQGFFSLTKNIHNLIHGQAGAEITAEDTALYEQINKENAEQLARYVQKNDIVVFHDPQPAGMAQELKKLVDVTAIWRCHIGLDYSNASTHAAWSFLSPHLQAYDHFVFSSPEYIPEGLSGNVTLIHPSLDPLSHKNRPLSLHKLTGILNNAGLLTSSQPYLYPHYEHRVARIQPDGTFGPAQNGTDIGLLFRPILTQVSRWDKLKGFFSLMEGFVELKKRTPKNSSDRNHQRIQNARLVLAGPDPASVADDPEGKQVLQNLIEAYVGLPDALKEDVVILTLPMRSPKENALIVNALQRSSYVVVQNSLQEGFGLTATEAMGKRIAVLTSSACGLRNQVRNHIDGRRLPHPDDPTEVAHYLEELLSNPKMVEEMSFSAEKRVLDHFLIFQQLTNWLNVFHKVLPTE